MEAEARSTRTDSPWRSRSFRLVWGASLINNVGDWLLLVALPVYVFTTTGSGTTTASLFVVELAVAVPLGALGGSLVDRWDLRRTLVVTNLAQAAALLPLLAVNASRVWPAFVVVGLESALKQVNDPAGVALLPRLVDADQLALANAANSTSTSVARLIGSPLGGVAVGLGGLGTVVVVDAATFLAVALAMTFVHADTGPRSSVPGAARPGVRSGLAEIRRRPPLPALLEVMALGQVAQGFFVVLFVVFVVERLGGGGTAVGVVRGAMAVGAIAGAALVVRWSRRITATRLVAVGYVGMGVTSFVFWNAPVVTTSLWLYPLLFGCSGLPGAALEIGTLTSLQQLSPPDVLGRVVGVGGAAMAAGSAVGSLVAGVLVDRVHLTVLLEAQASIYVVCGLLAVGFVARRRHPPRPSTGPR